MLIFKVFVFLFKIILNNTCQILTQKQFSITLLNGSNQRLKIQVLLLKKHVVKNIKRKKKNAVKIVRKQTLSNFNLILLRPLFLVNQKCQLIRKYYLEISLNGDIKTFLISNL